MKQHSHTYFLLLVFILLQYSCKKNDTLSQPYYNLEEVKAYSYFKIGSYWIYKDSITSIEDCVFVTSAYDTSGDAFNDFYETETYSTYENYYYKNWMNEGWATQYKNTPVWREKYKPGDVVGQTFLLVYPFILNKGFSPYTQYGTVTLIDSFTNFPLNNNVFHGVMKFNDNKNSLEGNSSTNFFVASHYGIIRKEILDSNQIWNLLRCNIVQ